MRKITKLLTLALAAMMIIGMIPFAASAAFEDVSVDDEALYEAVELLSTLGVAKGTSETTFGTTENVTRQQMAAFVYRLMKAGRSSEGGVNTTPFTDLEDSTYFNMVSWASNAGIIKGTSATTFNPKGGITLQDAYVMLVRALGYESEGALSYPHGYVDIAEEIGLDEDIPSTVDYTATLTRGQVAILLANAFYADMNETTVIYDWVAQNPNDPNTDWAYAPVEATETVAHKIFGVEEETFVVLSTAHYTLDGNTTYAELNDIDTVVGTRYDDAGVVIATGAEFEMEDLGLEGSSDDYFLAELTLFVKKDKNNDITKDEVIAAKSNLIKKTVTAEDVVLETSTKTDKEYYVGGEKTADGDKVMTGIVSFGDIKAYLDYAQAPYSYKKEHKLADSIKFITLAGGDYDEENATFEYATEAIDFYGVYGDTGVNGSYDTLTTEFAKEFPTVYYEGLYEADVYDSNGDGYIDYLFVKNLQFTEIIDKKNKDFDGLKKDDDHYYIYTEEATVEGEYESEDFVLAYVNAAAKYVKVIETVTPVEAMVVSKIASDDSKTVEFKTGEIVEFVDAQNKYKGYIEGKVPQYTDFTAGKTYKAYIKGDVLLYTDSVATGNYDIDADYAIVLAYDDEPATRYIYNGTEFVEDANEDRILYSATGVVDGEFVTYYYVNVLVDGAVKAVKLADYANTFVSYDGTDYALNAELDNQKITDKTVAETVLYNDFLGVFSTYEVDSDGAYTFTALDIETDTAKFADTEEEIAVYVAAASAEIENFTGALYNATGITGLTKFTMKDYSKLIIKTVDDDGDDVYTVYTTENLPDFAKTEFTNVMAIFVNNPKSSYENLGILYAEIDEFESDKTYDYRLVVGAQTIVGENGKEVDVITVLDVKTGEKTSNVEFAKNNSFEANGKFVIMNEAGEAVNEDENGDLYTIGTTYVENKLFTKKFNATAEYDDANKFLSFNGDVNTYVIGEDTTFLYYTSTSVYEMAEADILDIEDNPYEGLEDETALNLYIVAEDNDEKDGNEEIKIVKTVIVTKNATELSFNK